MISATEHEHENDEEARPWRSVCALEFPDDVLFTKPTDILPEKLDDWRRQRVTSERRVRDEEDVYPAKILLSSRAARKRAPFTAWPSTSRSSRLLHPPRAGRHHRVADPLVLLELQVAALPRAASVRLVDFHAEISLHRADCSEGLSRPPGGSGIRGQGSCPRVASAPQATGAFPKQRDVRAAFPCANFVGHPDRLSFTATFLVPAGIFSTFPSLKPAALISIV